jgi:RNA polymerase sigma-70 factor (ECF subfamily)
MALALQVFLDERPRLLTIARRVTGHAHTAEDIVQDAWLRWQRADRSSVQNPAAFLTTVTTHLAVNHVVSAPRRRERPCELPGREPGTPGVSSENQAHELVERTEELETALDALLASLSPTELSAYVLRKGFDYSYESIAQLLRTSASNCRQLVRRAQPRIGAATQRPVDPAVRRRLTSGFLHAARTGETSPLEAVLRDVVGAAPAQRARERAA